jgi:regulator of protease activity HflC (stomatin/prohibitin superfamily)
MGLFQIVSSAANWLFEAINIMCDLVLFWGGLIMLLAYPLYFLITNFKKYTSERKSASLLSETFILLVVVLILGCIWAIPEEVWTFLALRQGTLFTNEMTRWADLSWIFSSARLVELCLAFFAFAMAVGREHGETRWLRSAVIQIVIILAGWFFNRWLGVIFISLPLLVAYYTSLREAALIVMPASDPDDHAEQKRRVSAFRSYTWGIQSPMTVVDGHAWKKYEPRIRGDITWNFADFRIPFLKNSDWRPGVIWTPSHQVVSISGGTKFKRIDGPGIVFTGKLERLDQVFDLRLQLRTREIEVVSKDGVHFIARYFTAFRIDNEEWPRDVYNKVRPLNAILRGANKLSYTKGSFHFSNLRVQAALGITSTKATEDLPTVFWDQWVMNVVEDQTRKVISQKKLDEMWRPAEDARFKNAMDVIAKEIKESSETVTRSAGILLITARVVNFHFSAKEGELDEISQQQITTWRSEWERKRVKILSEAEAESERVQQEARAYAESVLLNAIAEGLQKTHDINPELPRFVIAQRFLSSLQDYIHKEPMDEEKRAELLNEFKFWQEQFSPKEK